MSRQLSKKRPGEPLEPPSMFVVVAVKDGDEGIFGTGTATGWMPFVTSTRATGLHLFEMARPIIEAMGEQARLIEYKRADVLES